MDKYPKWIIEDSTFKLGKVKFHRELSSDTTLIRGGGWFFVDTKTNTVYLYGKSEDFGKTTFGILNECFKNGNVRMQRALNKFNFKFSTSDNISIDGYWEDINTETLKSIG